MNDSQVASVVKSELTWLQKHERIILGTMVLVVVLWLGNKYLDNSAARAATIAETAKQHAAEVTLQASQAAAQYQATIDALQRQNASLAASIAQRQVVLQQKQTEIKTEPLPAVAEEWQRLIGGENDVVSNTTGLSVSESGARRTVSQLEEVPTLAANLADEKAVAGNLQTELGSANKLIAAREAELTANSAACKTEITNLKDSARKSKWHWFEAGYVAGLVTRGVIKIATGL
jgi:Skp family chaperone for outer membrane proteins